MVRGIDSTHPRMACKTLGGGSLLRPRNFGNALLLTWSLETAWNEEKKQASVLKF